MELILIPWCLIWAIICSLIGARKGAAFSYFFLGAILGPIGVVIALVGKGNRVKCAYCRKLIDPNASVCAWCQREVEPKTKEPFSRREWAELLIMLAFLLCLFYGIFCVCKS